MAHGKGTDDLSSSLFTKKRHQASERHGGVLKSSPLRDGRLHKPTAPEAWSRDSRPAQPSTLNPGWLSEPLEPDDTCSSIQTSRTQHSVNRVRELSTLDGISLGTERFRGR